MLTWQVEERESKPVRASEVEYRSGGLLEERLHMHRLKPLHRTPEALSPENTAVARPPCSISWLRLLSVKLGIKRLGPEADQSPPFCTEDKKTWSYTASHPYAFMVWCLIKHGDSFTC
jgi:hypothetical protein